MTDVEGIAIICTYKASRDTKMTSYIFTQAGLGQAPFKVIGYTEKSTGCAYCGRAIKRVSVVLSADGIKSNIGCECIKKAGDKGLVTQEKIAITKYKKAIKYAKQMDDYYQIMLAKWGDHPYVDQATANDKQEHLKELERVMKEVVNESNQQE